jgi:PAS domain S-box-containing protein
MVSPETDIAGPIIRNKKRTWAFVIILLTIVGMWINKYNGLRNRKVSLEREREYLLHERKLAEEVRATKAYLSALFDSTPDAIISTDQEGKLSFFSPGAEALLGHQADEVIGLPESVLFESEQVSDEIKEQMNQDGGRAPAFETALRTKAGKFIPVLLSASFLLDEAGHESGTVMFSKDLRERKEAEEELREAHEELQKAYEALEQAQASMIAAEKLAAVGRLSAGVSHEILNPLNIIVMRLHMMMEDPRTPSEMTRNIETLQEQAARITKIAQDLLYFSRKRHPERRMLDINEEVKRTLDLLDYDLNKQNIILQLELSEGLPPVVADTDQLQQVVLNLVTNARDAMPEGGQLLLRTEAVQANGQSFLELRVEDTGEGIAPDNLDKLFEPFFTTKPEGVGTGLGLSICQGIVESHGGCISAESELGQGTIFVIQLPLEKI